MQEINNAWHRVNSFRRRRFSLLLKPSNGDLSQAHVATLFSKPLPFALSEMQTIRMNINSSSFINAKRCSFALSRRRGYFKRRPIADKNARWKNAIANRAEDSGRKTMMRKDRKTTTLMGSISSDLLTNDSGNGYQPARTFTPTDELQISTPNEASEFSKRSLRHHPAILFA